MKRNKNKLDDAFCLHLAQLFYAVASADNEVAVEEMNALKLMVKKEWVSGNILSNSQARVLLSTFSQLAESRADSNQCFQTFKLYIENNHIKIAAPVKNLIWKTAERIASSYAHKNKSELIVLTKLKSFLLDLP